MKLKTRLRIGKMTAYGMILLNYLFLVAMYYISIKGFCKGTFNFATIISFLIGFTGTIGIIKEKLDERRKK